MVESALFFLIGFLSAAMLAILAAPAVSRRAMRLASARARLQAPLSETQARAERDALRAIQAVEIAKMERKVASAEWERAVALTDSGRKFSEFMKGAERARAVAEELDRSEQRVEALRRSNTALEAQAGASEIALWDLAWQRDQALARLSAARAHALELETHVDSSRTEIATLSTQVSALEVALADLRSGNARSGGDSAAQFGERLKRSEAAREALTLEVARLMKNAAERESRATLAEIEALRRRAAEAEATAESIAKGDAALRLAIAKLGRDIARARAGQDDEPHGAAQIVNFTRREPMA